MAKKTTKKNTQKVIKKTAKKAATKTTATKKSTKKAVKKTPKQTTKQAAQKTATRAGKAPNKPDLSQAASEEAFWTTDGAILRNLLELRDALQAMDKEVFRYHVTNNKNDFADWVEAVLCDGECAGELRTSTTPKQAQTVVVRYIKRYNV